VPPFYPDPIARSGNLSLATATPECIELRAEGGLPITIRHFTNIGWEVEVHYDQTDADVHRQPFTGAQEERTLTTLTLTDDADGIEVTAGDAVCRVSRADGTMEFKEGGRTLFVTDQKPFSAHASAVQIYDDLMSLKVTDFTDRAPFGPVGTLSESRMVRFSYPRPEGLVLGLPGQAGEMNRNGYRFTLENTDQVLHIPDRRPLYQSWPILFHKGVEGWVGIFHDNPTKTSVDIGDFYPERVTFESHTGNTRVFIVTGTSLTDVSQKMSLLLGPSVFPPAWAFGYQQCRWSYMSSKEVRSVVASLRKKKIPCDAIYYDIDYMDGFRVFTTNPETFGDLAACIADVRKEGVRSVCIVDPGVKVDQAYSVYEDLKKTGWIWKNRDGSDFVIKVWPGSSILPDFGHAPLRTWWAKLQAQWLSQYPFDGIWNDMNEPSNFDGANKSNARAMTLRGSVVGEQNLYGYSMAYASAEGWLAHKPGTRGIVISRSGYPGLQRFAVVWHGDNQAWWEHLRLAIDTAIGYSLCGAPYSGPDLPGFTGNPSDDLAVRFFQLGAFLPLFRGHSIYFAKDKEPYAYEKKTSALIKKAIELRYSLAREWYTGFAHAVKTGEPPLAPVLTEDGTLVRDHMLLFDKFLVAPITERDQSRKLIYLPEGDWYALGRPKRRIRGGRWISIAVTLKTIPVYVRAGSLVVRNAVGKNMEETLAAPETMEIYANANGDATGRWYNDDGTSIDDPEATWKTLTANATGVVTES
jgi:alpha-glucosidase